jgi:hypothetical protein
MQESSRKLFLLVTALVEAATGLYLLLLPAILFAVLLSLGHATAGAIVVGRLAGAALLAIPSWMARVDTHIPTQLGPFDWHSYLRHARRDAPCVRGVNLKVERRPALARGCNSHNSCGPVFHLFATGAPPRALG